jgi:hypothetical protein
LYNNNHFWQQISPALHSTEAIEYITAAQAGTSFTAEFSRHSARKAALDMGQVPGELNKGR